MTAIGFELTHYKQRYVPGIDGLRALAVIAVIVFHVDPSLLPGGFSGVDVFFVISGYVVSASLSRESLSSLRGFLSTFYARRLLRIYPVLIVCLLTSAVLSSLFIPQSWLSTATTKTGFFAFFGLSNLALIWFNDGYFSPRVEFNPFTHTWSLGVEEQFYLLFPVLFFVLEKGRGRRGGTGLLAKGFLPLLLLASLWHSARVTALVQDNAFYLLPSRFWELASGAVLFQVLSQQKKGHLLVSRISLLLGLLLIGIGFWFSSPKFFPFPLAMVLVLGTCLAITGVAGGSAKSFSMAWLLENKISVFIGKLSYSLYLWHWPVFVLFRWTVGLEGPVAISAAIFLTFLFSVLSYYGVETPVRKWGVVNSQPAWQIVLASAIAISVSAFFTLGVLKAQPVLSLSVTKDRRNWYPLPWPEKNSTESPSSPSRLGRKVFVFGDSHAGAYSTLLQKLSDEEGVVIEQYSKGGCSVVNLMAEARRDCLGFIDETVSDILRRASPGDVVFLASLRTIRLCDQWKPISQTAIDSERHLQDSAQRRAAILVQADQLIARFEQNSLHVVIDAPKPVFKSPPFRCADRFNSNNSACAGGFEVAREFLLDLRRPVMETLDMLVRRHPHLAVWDTFPILCPSSQCSAFDGVTPLFFDGDHLSAHGNRRLYPSFLKLLKSF